MTTIQLRQERLNRGWTLEYVGQQIGISNQAVSLIETGKKKPSYDVLSKLLALFNVDHKNISRLFAPVEKTHPNSNTDEEAVKVCKNSTVAAVSQDGLIVKLLRAVCESKDIPATLTVEALADGVNDAEREMFQKEIQEAITALQKAGMALR